MTNTQGAGDQRALQYLDITDFSPGCYDNSVIAFGTPTTTPGIFPAPPGAADASVTVGCIAEQNGGLGPLPALGGVPGTAGLSLSDLGISVTGTADISAIVNSQQNSGNELIIGVTDNFGGGSSQRTRFWSYVVGTGSLHLITGAGGTSNFASGQKNFVSYPFVTTLNIAAHSYLGPAVILPLAAPDGPTSQLMNYPSVASPTAFGIDTITTNPQGPSFGHQGRIVTIQANNAYSWPVTVSEFPDEAFSFTDPAESQTWPQQFEIFGPENPFGYGAVSSVSAGELFCIKRRGGGVIIQGDINNPTVTSLPGVQSTGEFYGHADTGANGMYYCSGGRGAWVWNGGNVSQKISPQLDDGFYTPQVTISDTTHYGYYVQRWNQMMMFSDSWIFNEPTNSWWRLENDAAHSYFWYVLGYQNRFLFAALASVPNASTKFLWEYTTSSPRSSYTWQSLPLRISPRDHTGALREVVIVASNPYGDAAPQIVVSAIDDKGNVNTSDTWMMNAGNEVQTTRLNLTQRETTTTAIRVQASGTLYAPVVHKLTMGYRSRQHVGLT